MNRLIAYVNASLEELRHLRWPTRQQAVRLAAIVLGFAAVSAVVFGIVDFALSKLIEFAVSLAV